MGLLIRSLWLLSRIFSLSLIARGQKYLLLDHTFGSCFIFASKFRPDQSREGSSDGQTRSRLTVATWSPLMKNLHNEVIKKIISI